MAGKKPDLQSEGYGKHTATSLKKFTCTIPIFPLFSISTDDSMNTMGIVHRNSKLVAGCGNGKLYMYHWKQFGYHSAEFPGHPAPINSLVAVTDNVIITACDDGAIR